jgi:quinol monooxygenase YgiN
LLWRREGGREPDGDCRSRDDTARGYEADTIRALRGFWDCTRALADCVGGGVFQELGHPGTALYVEMWQEAARLEAHVRSRGYERLLGIMETAAECPILRFNFVAETRGLAWVEQPRLGTGCAGNEG